MAEGAAMGFVVGAELACELACARCRSIRITRERRRGKSVTRMRLGENDPQFDQDGIDRRDFMIAAGAAACSGVPAPGHARFLTDFFQGEGKDVFQRTSFIYDVQQGGLNELTFNEALSRLAKKNVVFLGDHKNSLADHLLAARLIKELKKKRTNVAVALQEVQGKFQPALDDYIQGSIGEDKLYKVTQWRKNSTVAFDQFLGILWICRRYRIPMIAANAEIELLEKVRNKGIGALTPTERNRSMIDREGFAQSVTDVRFPVYEKAVIAPTFNNLAGKGLLGRHPDPKNYFASRILSDEQMAANIALYMQKHPETLVIALLNNDRVKYELGVPTRVSRISKALGLGEQKIGTVLLNLTTNEAGIDPKTNSLRTSYQLPGATPEEPPKLLRLCDMIWFRFAVATTTCGVIRVARWEAKTPFCAARLDAR